MYSKGRLFLKFINYWVIASNGKGHGTHSPFVFDFIIHVLNNCKNDSHPLKITVPSFGLQQELKYRRLIARISSYYAEYDLRLFSLFPFSDNVFSNSGKIFEATSEKNIHVITGIRVSENAEKKWREIKKNEKVTCSIDLFFVGILFFKKDFKEKLDLMIRF